MSGSSRALKKVRLSYYRMGSLTIECVLLQLKGLKALLLQYNAIRVPKP